MGFNVRTEAERVSSEIEIMKNNVKQKAKKQIDELIDNLKTNEFLKSPAIQSLVEKVGNQRELNQKINQKVESIVENVRNDVVAKVEAPVKRVKKAAQKADAAVRKVKSTSPKELLNMIKTSDMATKIANRILSGAENINQKWLETVARSPLAKRSAAKKAAAKVTKKAKTAKKTVAKASAKTIKNVKKAKTLVAKTATKTAKKALK